MLEISWVAEQLLASREGLNSMKLVRGINGEKNYISKEKLYPIDRINTLIRRLTALPLSITSVITGNLY
jgi:hypothetical protein